MLAVFLFFFGVLSFISGGSVLMSESARVAAGNAIPFIIWFNVLASPFYLLTGAAIWLEKPYAAKMGILLFVAYLAVDAFLLFHVQSGGSFEWRTVYAMGFRTVVWGGATLYLLRSRRSG